MITLAFERQSIRAGCVALPLKYKEYDCGHAPCRRGALAPSVPTATMERNTKKERVNQ